MPFGRIDQRMRLTNESIDTAQKYLDHKGIRYSQITQRSSNRETYTALEIEDTGNSVQNREARRVSLMMGGMPLVFSPFDLSFGSNGYMQPDGSHLGVSYRFLTEGPTDSTYQHEILHASTLNDIVNGKSPLWAGEMKARDRGTSVSSKNSAGYSGYAALDEMLASSLSVKLDAERLMKLKATMSPKDFSYRWGEGHALVSDLRFTLQNGENLAKQIADLCERSLAKLDSVEIKEAKMVIGKKSAVRYHAVFVLDAYEMKKVIPFGTRFTLFYGSRPTINHIKTRLEMILRMSRLAQPRFEAARKTIFMGIELPDVEKSDINSLIRLAPEAYKVLVR